MVSQRTTRPRSKVAFATVVACAAIGAVYLGMGFGMSLTADVGTGAGSWPVETVAAAPAAKAGDPVAVPAPAPTSLVTAVALVHSGEGGATAVPSAAGPVARPKPTVDPNRPFGRLPCGGPGLVLATATWTAAAEAVAPAPGAAAAKQPIPFIWDFAVIGGCGWNVAPDGADPGLTADAVVKTLVTLLGRVRVAAIACVPARSSSPREEQLKAALRKGAPAWRLRRVSTAAGNLAQFVLERRQRLFTFAITGGRDGRAAYVERTWGRRTPTQWYGDQWDPLLRPIVDLHPKYLQDRFDFLTFKISRIWQRVHEDFGTGAAAAAYADPKGQFMTKVAPAHRAIFDRLGGGRYDWYVRLWDDNYFYEENLHPALARFDPATPVMTGKMGWRYMADNAVYPFAGGGAGWYLSRAGLDLLGPSIADAEKWFVDFRARKDIFLPHAIHDEDVFLSAWLSMLNVSMKNIPGVEHVSPGRSNKQRCMDHDTLVKLRWDDDFKVYFNYPGKEAVLRIDEPIYAYFKPIVWHYMSPTRLIGLETLLYPERRAEFEGEQPPRTASDAVKKGKPCYPGVPPGPPPPRSGSIFETPVTDPPVELGGA